MNLRSIRNISLEEAKSRTGHFIAACGYERRSRAISRIIGAGDSGIAICFGEFADALARPQNEDEFTSAGFKLVTLSGNDSQGVQEIISSAARAAFPSRKALTVDISSMTRAWHGGIVRQLRTMNTTELVEVIFAYVPAVFKRPVGRISPNEFVAPVNGFASLATPNLPVTAIIGLGYEKERALGIQQILDPQSTLLFIPRSGDGDLFYREVLRSNRDILSRTPADSIFEYALSEPAAAFATLASLIGGLQDQYRIVLVSLGPKIFGLLCFLLATRFPNVSVWRVSAGVHGRPRDAEADPTRMVALSTVWGPSPQIG